MDKYIGRLLDNRYEILEVLGTGGMAVVYKARCHRLNRLVAIKILKDDYLEDEEFRRRFHSESQAVAMLSHPNIVSIYDVSSSVTADYIVMELIDGITLKQYMEKKGVLNWKETLHFAIQIAKALEHAHGRGIVHRDIKPHNVMVLKNGSVKVTDFGIARMMSKGNTLTKEALGSVHYISPEQAKGGRVDSRSDLYSLGVVMYEMMSGRPPYDGESPVAVAIQHINGGAVLPSTLNPNIPGGLEQIIMKAMAHDPAQRFDSATSMLKDMDDFRKLPSILFDYNVPPIDEVTKLPRSPIVFENPKTQSTAKKVEQAAQNNLNEQPRRSAMKHVKNERQRNSQSNNSSGSVWPPERRKTNKKQDSNIAAIAVIICSIAIILALIIFFIVQFSGSDKEDLVTVPNLIGKDFDLHYEYSDFDIKLAEEKYNDVYPEGVIFEQSPVAGSEVSKNTPIYVSVSRGKQTSPEYMPDLINWIQAKAETNEILRKMGIKVKIVSVYDEEIVAGHVIKTEPVAGTELVQNMEVTLVVSLGVETVTMPIPAAVLELSCNVDQAEALLKAMNLNLSITKVPENHSTIEKDMLTKIEVVPIGATTLSTNGSITLYYSIGPKLVIMPNLIGMPIGDVPVTMLKYGFEQYKFVEVDSSGPINTVVGQSVEANREVDVTTMIEIEIPKGTQAPVITQKDVVLSIKGAADHSDVEIYVEVDGTEVFKEVVLKGTQSITIKNQTGTGKKTYWIKVGEEAWAEEVTFDEAE